MDNVKNEDVVITEHSILRYIEYTDKKYLNKVKEKLSECEDIIKSKGDGRHPIDDNLLIIVRDNVLVTIIKQGNKK